MKTEGPPGGVKPAVRTDHFQLPAPSTGDDQQDREQTGPGFIPARPNFMPGGALRSRAQPAGTGAKPANSTRRIFLLPLMDATIC
jgi:hypothetical protein